MDMKCPVCKKTFFPIKASMGLNSNCLHCKNSLRATNNEASKLGILLIIVVGAFIRKYLEIYINEYLALILMIAILWIYLIFTTVVHQTYEVDS